MSTVESDKKIKQYLEEQKRQEQIQLLKLRKNLESFTAKELKKETIAMKADKLAVTKLTREQLINLISFHWLFPHSMTKKGTKRDPTAAANRRRRPLTRTPKLPNNERQSGSG